MAKKATVGDAPEGEAPVLRRSLTRLDLLVIGVAQIIGAGIFVISGVGVRIAGPGLLQALGTLVCLGLMLSMPATSWWRLGLWLLVGLAVYFLYACRSDRLRCDVDG